MRSLVEIPEHRPQVAKSCLPALVKLMQSTEEEEPLFIAVEVLSLLSKSKGALPLLCQEDGLLECVKKQVRSSSERTKTLAVNLYVTLQSEEKKQQSGGSTYNANFENQKKSTAGNIGFFSEQVSSQLQKAKTVILYIKGLTSEDTRSQVETALVSVKGVISFMIDLYGQKATIRTMTTMEVIIKAIRDQTGLIALPPNSVEKLEDKENSEPDYLPEPTEEDNTVAKGSILLADDPLYQKKANNGAGLLTRLSSWWYGAN